MRLWCFDAGLDILVMVVVKIHSQELSHELSKAVARFHQLSIVIRTFCSCQPDYARSIANAFSLAVDIQEELGPPGHSTGTIAWCDRMAEYAGLGCTDTNRVWHALDSHGHYPGGSGVVYGIFQLGIQE